MTADSPWFLLGRSDCKNANVQMRLKCGRRGVRWQRSCVRAVARAAAAGVATAARTAARRQRLQKSEQVVHARAHAMRRDTQLFGWCVLPVEPKSGEAEPRGARHVPAVRRHEDDLARL